MTPYLINNAFSGLWRDRWINLLSVLTIGTGLMMAAFAWLAVHNARLAVGRLPERFSVTVFLADSASDADARELIGALRKLPAVKGATYMSREDALKELKAALSDSDVLEGLSENPLPASVELRVNESAVTEATISALALDIKKMKGVGDVQYGMKLLSVIESVKKYADSLGALLMAVVFTGVGFVCYSTVRILLSRKDAEIETLKILGATKWFIRMPFIIEGAIIGFLSGAACTVGLLVLKLTVYQEAALQMPMLKSLEAPPDLFLTMPLAGLLIGVTGALLAVGMIRY